MKSPDDFKTSRPRSYVLRQGRITPAQRTALDELMPKFGLSADAAFDPLTSFGRQAPLFLEIGFGNGETLLQTATAEPDHDFIGIEVHAPGVGHLLLGLTRLQIANVRVYRTDAAELLERQVPDSTFDGIMIYFPDPWPKSRHHKRRLIDTEFVELAASKLKPQGIFHAATDWRDYADQILEAAIRCERLTNCAIEGGFSARPPRRPLTKFERRGLAKGHGVWDIVFRRSD
ncbi:MAG: tRNA (guanosine(46)-N7)-methyltransferase TrmB [Methylotetracoccus sp.]